MLDKLNLIKKRFEEISEALTHQDVISNQKKYISLHKEYKDLQIIVEKRLKYKELLDNISEAESLLKQDEDEDMIEMAKNQLEESKTQLLKLEENIKILLIPKDPEDSKNAMMEIRAGTGGDEASIFAGDLYRMYSKYCETKGWKTTVMDFSEGTSGGFKEIILEIQGKDAYGFLKFEAGVHRVQRVPQTETQGRVHTSASSVVVMPEAEEFDVEINMKDVRKDLFCSSGPGGQSVNTTYSAVRLTHIPTGIVAQCQDEKSQHKNFEKALKVLRSRVYEIELEKRMSEDAKKRKSMVTSGDRSAKIRTYNYPQSRVTDHRIGLTLYDLENIINGDIDRIIEQLKLAENTEHLKEITS